MNSQYFPGNMENQLLSDSTCLFQFRKNLLSWGQLNFRFFPWRLTRDPYAILMAEIMLHRTQVKQVLSVYNNFLQKFPDIDHLHAAKDEMIKEALESLGLHWRTQLIKIMATEICNRFASSIPQEKELLISLPGISVYIASAVRCFAWNFPDPIVDTNTVRIVGRIFGEPTKDSTRRNQRIRARIENLVDPDEPARFNYALLDLAHLVCHKKIEPECQICPIRSFCNLGLSRYPELGK